MATATTTDTLRPRISPLERLTGPGARRLALGAGVLTVELVLAAALASGRLSSALLGFVAAGAVAVAFAFPMATAVLVLVVEASIFHGNWFEFSLGGFDVKASEALVGVLFLVALTRPRQRVWGGPAGTGLGVFLALLTVSTVLAIGAGSIGLIDSIAWTRVFFVYLFFYAAVRLFDAAAIRRLLGWGAGVAAVTGIVALYLAVASGPGSFLQDPAQQFIRSQEGLGVLQRVRLPGLALAYGLFWYALVRALRTHGTPRLVWAAALGGMAASIVLSFNRNMWVGLAVGLILMLALSGPLVRRRLVAALAALIVAAVLLPSQFGVEEGVSPLIERGTSLADPESLRAERSLLTREIETEAAWNVALANPLIGIGPGVEFGVAFYEATPHGVWVRVPQLFLHNQYLYLMLIAGIPAVLAFLAFLLTSLRSAWRWRDRTPESAAVGVGLFSIMLSAVVAIYFSTAEMVFAITLLAAAIYVMHREVGSGADGG